MTQFVTADSVAEHALEPSLNATALQLRAARLLDRRDTPQVDSLVECLAVMKGAMAMAEELIVATADALGLQLPELQHVNGWADQLVTALADDEHNTPPGQRPPSGRKIAHQIVSLLAVIDAATSDDLDRHVAHRDLFAIFDTVTEPLLFHQRVTYHLGVHRTQRLRDLHDRYTQRRAPREPVAA